jgi:Protein of unknown function (DUF3618)
VTSGKKQHEQATTPGDGPTDEDLRHEAEHTRQELAETVAALGEKTDVKNRIRKTAHDKAETLRVRGDELVDRLPEQVATRVRPVVTGATRRPMIPLAGVLGLLLVMLFWLKRRSGSR